MVIDLDRCTGCNACVTACAMENNVAFAGEEENAYGRGMHWIRLVRYWEGEYPEAQMRTMPMMCQQCSNAPCEPVCPVFATLHSEAEEINIQVYNRCIGTRYCANNCPYIARMYLLHPAHPSGARGSPTGGPSGAGRRGAARVCPGLSHRRHRLRQLAGPAQQGAAQRHEF